MMTSRAGRISVVGKLFLCLCCCAYAAEIPLEMPKPDGEPGNSSKPVKVYVLTGQSNMVGFGRLTGAPPFTGVFLTADKNIVHGDFSAAWPSRYLIASHGVYQSAGPDAEPGAKVSADGVGESVVALGTVAEHLPNAKGVTATAYIDVPETGHYMVYVGHGDSSYNVTTLDGKEVYRRDAGGQPVRQKVTLEKGKRYKVEISYARTGSAAFWLEQVDLTGKGDLTSMTKTEKLCTYLLDDEGNWSVRNDVTFAEARVAAEGRWCPLSATANGGHIGPELGFGYVMGEFHDEQVLLIKTAMGNRALSFDFLPPSSGRPNPDNKFEGLEYDLTVKGVKTILSKIDQVVPGYKGQGYEIVGLVWWQGHKDRGRSQAEYEKHMVNLIKDLRKDLDAPNMRTVIATVGFDGYRIIPEYMEILKAQMAVADPEKHPEFAGTVATVDARGFWYDRDESPTGTGYHYNHNAKTQTLLGDALGRAMVELLGGKAEPRVAPNTPEDHVRPEKKELTEDEQAAHKKALYAIIADGMLPAFAMNERNKPELQRILKGEKPGRISQFPRDVLDQVARYYRAVGISDYDWQPVVPDMMNGKWDYFMYNGKLPEGMANWYALDFDAKKAGWKTGKAPFGNKGGALEALRPGGCTQTYCNCGTKPGTLWDKDVLMMRQTFKLPEIQKGHRYRMVVGGASHVKSGTGWKVYMNGKLLAQCGSGVPNRAGGQPRGGHVYSDLLPELESGKITVAVTSSLQKNKNPSPQGHLSVNLEVQKIPEAIAAAID